MSKLSTIRKQIAALEAQAARIAKAGMDSAIEEVRSLMSDFGLTVEHLTHSVTGKAATKRLKSVSTKATAKKAGSAAKYADPKSGKTWSGRGRAPGWIAASTNRDAFLVSKGTALTGTASTSAAKTEAIAKKSVKHSAGPPGKAIGSVTPAVKKAISSVKSAVPKVRKAAGTKVASAKKPKRKLAATQSSVSQAAPDAPAAE